MTDRQPTRKSSRGQAREDRQFDQTSLRESGHGQLVHRDYAAHFFRWGFAKKGFITHDVTTVLDIGCGPDLALMKVLLGGGPKQLPKHYTGVDLNSIRYKGRPSRATIHQHANFLDPAWRKATLTPPYGLLTCFEVIEHMPVPEGLALLKAAREQVAKDGHFLLSTPVFNGAAARNHIHEYTIPELQGQVEKAGWTVAKRYGTFASWPELKKALQHSHAGKPHLDTIMALRDYYDGEVLSCFLAPLYPDASRNNLWVLTPR